MSATLDLSTCPFLDVADLGVLLRSKELAKRAIYHGWIQHCTRTGPKGEAGPYLYERAAVDALAARIRAGEVPPAMPRNSKSEAAQAAA